MAKPEKLALLVCAYRLGQFLDVEFDILKRLGGLCIQISESLCGLGVLVHLDLHELIQCILEASLVWWLV